MSEQYNGWTNYETWNVPLWIDNDSGLYHAKVAFLRTCGAITAGSVETFCRDIFPGGTPDMDSLSDMALVNWAEIADAWRDELAELKKHD